jgi:hypothetical protein
MKLTKDLEEENAAEVGLHGEYIPSQAEIRSQCERIRESWSERERSSRAVNRNRRWTVPVFKVTSWF